MGRDLMSNERAVLDWLLADPHIPDVDTLRAQIPFTKVVAGVPNLPTFLYLEVVGAPPADCPDGVLPGEAVVESADGEATGFLMLWVERGYLSFVEHPWVTDEMPVDFPSVDRLRPATPEARGERPSLGET